MDYYFTCESLILSWSAPPLLMTNFKLIASEPELMQTVFGFWDNEHQRNQVSNSNFMSLWLMVMPYLPIVDVLAFCQVLGLSNKHKNKHCTALVISHKHKSLKPKLQQNDWGYFSPFDLILNLFLRNVHF